MEKEKTIEEKILEFAETVKKQKYDFEWTANNGLNFVSDESLEIAYEILNNSEIKLEVKDGKTFIYSRIAPICERMKKDLTSETLLKLLKKKDSSIILGKEKELLPFNTYGFTIDTVCYNCKCQRCPKLIAGYIYYLICNGTIKEILEKRKEYRDKNNPNRMYAFDWKFGDALKIISDEMFEFSKKIVDENRIFVSTDINKSGYVNIKTQYSCTDFKTTLGDKNKIIDNGKPYSKWASISRSVDNPVLICNTYSCNLKGCPILIAAVIMYLQKSGREDEIKSARNYYHSNKKELDKVLEDVISNKENAIEEKINKSVENFKKYQKTIDNLDELLAAITNVNQTNIRCIVEGDEKEERKQFIESVVDYIKTSRKVADDYVFNITLQNLTTGSTYGSSKGIYPGNITKDENGISYASDGLVRYTEIPKNSILVLNGVEEFIKDYRTFIDLRGVGYREEVRSKQFKHIIDLITNVSSCNYIIIHANSKEADTFVELEPRLQFVYKNARYKIPGVTLDETFDIFVKKLSSSTGKILISNKSEYKKEFIEYITINKSFIPFSNSEIAAYLATYCNTKGDIVFPANIYKKETVEEALKNIVGLDTVKEKVKEFEKYMMFKVQAEAQGIELASSNMHMIFTGNPGTGKTSIARIMAKMLYDMGIVKENKLVEVERKDLVAGYIGQTAIKTSEVIDKAMGGILFIDEAYSLASKGANDFGGEAIATLIKAMEDRKDDFVVIFAGYKTEMKRFLDINPGISSRIGYQFDFQDYNSDELVQIFYKKIEKIGLKCSKKCDAKLKKICKYFSQRKDFGNGRFIDKLIQETILKHAIGDGKDIKTIEDIDIPTIQELSNSNTTESTTEELLNDIIGLEELKDKIREFENYVNFIKQAEKEGISIPNGSLHMIFTGNPGTGKTTIARIMAQILFNAGIIYENKLIEVERKDLVGEYIGHTAPKTADVIERAMGGVLFIDEAYSLSPKSISNDFGEEAIATIIKAMEDHKGELVVIFAGYEKEMHNFINTNPGIASRVGYKFHFPDYSADELIKMFYRKIEKSGFECKNCDVNLKKVCTYFSQRKDFGNGRFVDKLIQETILKHAKSGSKNIREITGNDIPTIQELSNSNKTKATTEELLKDVVGLDDLKEKIKEFEAYARFVKEAERKGINIPNQNMHMIFTGNPGTGKTTIARIMASILFNTGVIYENKVIEVERKDLIGQYIGHTAPKTMEVIERAMGGVLFIDEAYSLSQKSAGYDFGGEAVATLIKAMEDHKGEFVVIFAGYKKEMNDFINMNSGIASRIGYVFDFKDYSREELIQILRMKVENSHFIIDEGADQKIFDLMNYFNRVENIGNGRFADKVFHEILMKHAKNADKEVAVIKEQDIPTINEMTACLFNGEKMINPDIIDDEALRRTAIHEIGHAFVRYKLYGNPAIIKITIKPEGTGTLGYVRNDISKFSYTSGKTQKHNWIKILLAGMGAEEVFLGEFDDGNGSDLEKATAIAKNMVMLHGMSDLGYGQIKDDTGAMGVKIQKEINHILGRCYKETIKIIKENKLEMNKLAKYLLKKQEITGEEFLKIAKKIEEKQGQSS